MKVADQQVAADSRTAVYARNVTAGGLRIAVNALVAVVLPTFLTHKLPVSTYAAWVLVLQLSAYVSYLDFGVQMGVAKYVAEYHEQGDREGCSISATAGFRLIAGMALLGFLLVPLLTLTLPHLFKAIPVELQQDTRWGVLLVGLSLSFNLGCTAFAAIFTGLQRYQIPSFLGIANKLLYGLALLLAVFLHARMRTMGLVVAGVNVGTGLLQVAAWRRWAPWISVHARLRGTGMMRRMMAYCGVLALWSAGMLCVSGLDLTIVAHYAFNDTAFYAIAAAPANLMLLCLSAGLGPLLPAASALSVTTSARKLGELMLRVTRYSALLLALAGLPILVWGRPLLLLWVGPVYAAHCLPLLRILIVANMVRNLLGPYATFVVATGRQRVATASALAEALSNLVASIVLAQRFGGLGVAYGTLIGAVVGVLVHFAVSMRYTYASIELRRSVLLRNGLLRPSLVVVPSVLVLLAGSGAARPSVGLLVSWTVSTALLGWFVSLEAAERERIVQSCSRMLGQQGAGRC